MGIIPVGLAYSMERKSASDSAGSWSASRGIVLSPFPRRLHEPALILRESTGKLCGKNHHVFKTGKFERRKIKPDSL